MNSDSLSNNLDEENVEISHKSNSICLDVVISLLIQKVKSEEVSMLECICKNTDSVDDTYSEEEIVPNLEIPANREGNIKLLDFVNALKKCGYPLNGAIINIYKKNLMQYIRIEADPVDKNIVLDESYFPNKIIKIKAICYIDEKFLNENIIKEEQINHDKAAGKKDSSKKRTKEREIGYIIEKVNNWRRLYNGYYDNEGKFTKYSLDESAKIIGISKKSLDDYLLQLRHGRKFGYDFNANKRNKVGDLRKFVKENRENKLNNK